MVAQLAEWLLLIPEVTQFESNHQQNFIKKIFTVDCRKD